MSSPQQGFNNNVRHRGRVFHIQTEDSGVRHPHVITHVFVDGGRIVKTVKTSYAEHIDAERLVEVVRAIMREQHRSVFIALRDGQFDRLLELGPPVAVAPRTSSPDLLGAPADASIGASVLARIASLPPPSHDLDRARYASTRPAAIFDAPRPSLGDYGDEPDDASIDGVILAYLAEDADAEQVPS